MSQNITLWGASYSAVPSVTLPKTGGGTASFTDVTDTTAAASDVASGKYFYTSSGVRTQGTNSGGGGDSKNTQIVQGTTRESSSTPTNIGAEMTVSKTGTYDVYWDGFRSTTSGSYTYATQLYIDGVAYGSENATWSQHCQNNHLQNVSLTQGQKLRVRGRNSRGSSYYIYAPTLVIIEV